MSHVSYSELRANFAKYMDEVCDSRAPLHVTRQNARSVVMLSEDEYRSIMETLHLLESPANQTRLLRSIEQANGERLQERELAEDPADEPA